MSETQIKNIIEASLMVADRPLASTQLQSVLEPEYGGEALPGLIVEALDELQQDYAERGVELKQVARGYRFQARPELATWVNRLWEERPPRYSRALLETLALIAYRQPVTRGEIEALRGVALSTGILKTLLERHWVRVAGHRDVPGHPAVYATTSQFLEYFNLKTLGELPPLPASAGGVEQIEMVLDSEAGVAREVEGLDGDEGNEPLPQEAVG